MKDKEFKYRRDWLIPSFLGTMLTIALILFLSISFSHRSYIFDKGRFEDHYIAYLILAAVIGYAAKCWYDVFDNRIVLLINADGIYIREDLITWNQLSGYKMVIYENTDGEGGERQDCIFDFADERPDMTLRLEEIQVRMDEIITAITHCSSNPNIVFRGYEKKK